VDLTFCLPDSFCCMADLCFMWNEMKCHGWVCSTPPSWVRSGKLLLAFTSTVILGSGPAASCAGDPKSNSLPKDHLTLSEVFVVFISRHKCASRLPQYMQWPLPSTFFLIHCSLITLPVIAM
jgi:hypothetical protein